METLQHEKQVSIINNSLEVFKTAPEILKQNQERSRKAVIVGKDIINQWEKAWNIKNDEERLQALAIVDERSNKFLVNCSTALKEEKELRAVITQMMDEFKKWFTAAENEIDKTKAGSVADQVQGHRDSFAKEAAMIAARKKQEAEEAAAREKEAISIKSFLEKYITEKLIDIIARKKSSMTTAFNAITLETIDQKEKALKGMVAQTSVEALKEEVKVIEIKLPLSYHLSVEKVIDLSRSIESEFNWSEFVQKYSTEISQFKNELIEKLPSKRNELLEEQKRKEEEEQERERQRLADEKRQKELKAAQDEEERKKLIEKQEAERKLEAQRLEQLKLDQEKAEQDRLKREKEDQEKIAKEAEEQRLKAEQDIEMKAQGEKTLVLFEQEASISEVTNTPEARQGFEIEILHPAAYVQIFQLWFEKEGKNLPVTKIGNTKLDQMKAWAEKLAHKTGEKIESKFIRYEETFKAVNRK